MYLRAKFSPKYFLKYFYNHAKMLLWQGSRYRNSYCDYWHLFKILYTLNKRSTHIISGFGISNSVLSFLIILLLNIHSFYVKPLVYIILYQPRGKKLQLKQRFFLIHLEIMCNKYCKLRIGPERVIRSSDTQSETGENSQN